MELKVDQKITQGPLILSEAEYRKHPAVSQSSLKHMEKSPGHYLHALMNPPEQTEAMAFGTYLHTAVLEPLRFESEFVKAPDFGDLRTKDGKARRDEFQARNADKTILSVEDFDAIKFMSQAIYEHPKAAEYLTNGMAESSHFWTDLGIDLKCRPDYVTNYGAIVDVKTVRNGMFKDVQRSVVGYGYDYQAAFYLDGVSESMGERFERFIIIAVEKTPFYGVRFFELTSATIELGRMKYKRHLETLSQCLETNHFPGYSTEITPLDVPSWAYEIEGEYE